MKRPNPFEQKEEIHFLREVIQHLALMPRRVLVSLGVSGLLLSTLLLLTGMVLYQPSPLVAGETGSGSEAAAAPAPPADFTPVATPPPAFMERNEEPTPTAVIEPSAEAGVATTEPTVTEVPDPITDRSEQSDLTQQHLVSILLLGLDSRSDKEEPARTDAIMVALLDTRTPSLTVISIPRDLWVSIPGFQPGRINTAYFLGDLYGRGIEVARRTASQTLGVPIHYTVLLDFEGFRRIVDLAGGIEIDVPEPIDDPSFPDSTRGTFRLVIPAGEQHMDGQRALQYARTRHGNSDIRRAERQQAILEALWDQILAPEQLPNLPSYVKEGMAHVDTNLSITDLFFLARAAKDLERDQVYTHVIRAPLLWNGMTADGQQVLLYDSWTLQQAVQRWLAEARRP